MEKMEEARRVNCGCVIDERGEYGYGVQIQAWAGYTAGGTSSVQEEENIVKVSLWTKVAGKVSE